VNAAENQTAVTDVDATDPDAGALLTYTISGGADQGLSRSWAGTGVLTFSSPRDFETFTDANAMASTSRSHRQRRPGGTDVAVDQRHGHQRQRGPGHSAPTRRATPA